MTTPAEPTIQDFIDHIEGCSRRARAAFEERRDSGKDSEKVLKVMESFLEDCIADNNRLIEKLRTFEREHALQQPT